MKILIADFKEELTRDIEWEKEKLRSELLDETLTFEVYAYRNKEEFIEKIKDADVLMTAFLPVGKEELAAAKKLKLIAVNATGYGTIDIEEATKRQIAVRPVLEYCTQEVAEHTIALMLSLQRGLKRYEHAIEDKKSWNYLDGADIRRIEGQTLAIFGYGKIGKAVAKRAEAFGMKILAVDPYQKAIEVAKTGATLVEKEEALKRADVISNHMNQTSENRYYFSTKEFDEMKQKPIFLNAGRGSCVDEQALMLALDEGKIRAAGLDVLEEEYPNLEWHPLIARENVILTPHAAFYSKTSMRKLQQITCENIIDFWKKITIDDSCKNAS